MIETLPYNLASDVLERQFGLCTLTVLQQDESTRFISVENAEGDTLELARVDFTEKGIQEFADTHNAIVGGKSMGKAFRDEGIEFTRELTLARRQTLPDNLRTRFDLGGLATVMLLDIYVGTQSVRYAQILEVYSPEVNWRPYVYDHGRTSTQNQALLDSLLESFPPLNLEI